MWFQDFQRLEDEVKEISEKYSARCDELGVSEATITGEFYVEFLSRAVYESNWQEGLKLEQGKTLRYADMALDDISEIRGPRLDINSLVTRHQGKVNSLFKEGATPEEVGAYNLALAHRGTWFVRAEVMMRENAALALPLQQFVRLKGMKRKIPPEVRKKASDALKGVLKDKSDLFFPVKGGKQSSGEYAADLLKSVDHNDLLRPLNCAHLHFLHRITMMGMLPPDECGHFRRDHVHVANPDLLFPPPSAVPAQMEAYCREFPSFYVPKFEGAILTAAKASHRFVAIHPYSDGNGRVSRLIMNLLLGHRFPPVYLKANKKGRHRYSQALRRADRGNYDALAALIAGSLIEIYEKMLSSLTR